mgnify:FL=1
MLGIGDALGNEAASVDVMATGAFLPFAVGVLFVFRAAVVQPRHDCRAFLFGGHAARPR